MTEEHKFYQLVFGRGCGKLFMRFYCLEADFIVVREIDGVDRCLIEEILRVIQGHERHYLNDELSNN